MGGRLRLLRLNLIDVFAVALYNPNDQTDVRVLDLLDQLGADVVALQSAVCEWSTDEARRDRSRERLQLVDVADDAVLLGFKQQKGGA